MRFHPILAAAASTLLAMPIASQCGAQWSSAGGLQSASAVYAFGAFPNGDLAVGGGFLPPGFANGAGIARWDGIAWSPLGPGAGVTGQALAITFLPNGDMVAGGGFANAGGAQANNIARWDGTSWSAMGSGLTGAQPSSLVLALVTMPNGDVVAGGRFLAAGGVAANNIARWNGTTWAPLGAGTGDKVIALALAANGDLFAGGLFATAGGLPANAVARWNGATWAPLGSGTNGLVWALAALPNGDIVAGGSFTTAGGAPANSVARWNGATWAPLGSGINGFVTALGVLPNGDLVAGGAFANAGGVPANDIARWDGNTWSAFGAGITGGTWTGVTSFAIHSTELVVGGTFLTAGGLASPAMASLQPTCPPAAMPFGSGCTGSSGPNVLTATTLPWLGSTFAFTATGMPSPGLAVGVRGLAAQATPLAAILPQGIAGCSLLVSPDLLDLHVPSGNVVTASFPIPNVLALAGQTLLQQVVALALAPTGSIQALTSTNALAIALGTL